MKYKCAILIGFSHLSWIIEGKKREIEESGYALPPISTFFIRVGPEFYLRPGLEEEFFLHEISKKITECQSFPLTLNGWRLDHRTRQIGTELRLIGKWSDILGKTMKNVSPWFFHPLVDHLYGKGQFIPLGVSHSFGHFYRLQKITGQKRGFIHSFAAFIYPSLREQKYIRPISLINDANCVQIQINGKISAEYELKGSDWKKVSFKESGTVDDSPFRFLRTTDVDGCMNDAHSNHREIFLIGDLHLGHAEIIHYCGRPFVSPEEMDQILIDNWNRTVHPDDRAVFLGDLTCGATKSRVKEYLGKLNGHITFISGNHDIRIPGTVDRIEMRIEGIRFLFVHRLKDAPPDYPGWIVHGHSHNISLQNHPFINGKSRRINVSAELIGYRPVSLYAICRIIREIERKKRDSTVLRQDLL